MNKYSKILLPTFYIGIIAVMVLCSTLVVSGVKTYLLNRQEMKFTIDNVFDEDTTPVVKTETNIIVKPYISDSVKVGRYFYDFESDEKKQEKSLISYEDTYMQNSGVDYTSDSSFDVISILDGTVINVYENKILGTSIEVRHSNELISVYQSLSEVTVKEGDNVIQGQILAKSGLSNINKELSNHLHFELYYKGSIVNPEEYYNKSVDEL